MLAYGNNYNFVYFVSWNLAKFTITSSSVFWDTLGFSMYLMMSSATEDSFISPFLYAFYFFFLPIALVSVFSTMLSKSGYSSYVKLFSVSLKGESIQYYTIKYDVSGRVFIDDFYQFEEVPFYSLFAESLKNMLDAFSPLLKWFLNLWLLKWSYGLPPLIWHMVN